MENLLPSAARILLPSTRSNATAAVGRVSRQSESVETFEEAIVGGVELELDVSPNSNLGERVR